MYVIWWLVIQIEGVVVHFMSGFHQIVPLSVIFEWFVETTKAKDDTVLMYKNDRVYNPISIDSTDKNKGVLTHCCRNDNEIILH